MKKHSMRMSVAWLSLIAALACVGVAIWPMAAAADQPGWSVVEGSQRFCVDQSQPCGDFGHLGNLGYAEAAGVNFSGKATATPDAVVLVCAYGYTDSNGDPHAVSGHVFAGPTQYGYDGGTISGTMTVLRAATEASTDAYGRLNISATDRVLGTHGTATGLQESNNVTDLPITGGFNVTISGTITDENFNTGTSSSHQGTISCTTNRPYAIGPAGIGQPPDSESVISDTDSD